MTLKERLIQEIDNLTPEELVAIQSVIYAFASRSGKHVTSSAANAYLAAREALADYPGNLSDDIVESREDRI